MRLKISDSEKIGDNLYVDLTKPIDLSIPLDEHPFAVNSFYAPKFRSEPVKAGEFIGSVRQGGPVNFRNVFINPHGNGTHTECVGHIASEPYTINQSLKQFAWWAELISIKPLEAGPDKIITLELIQEALGEKRADALIIRTLPFDLNKKRMQWSGSNPPYLEAEAASWLVEIGVQHLLLDLPSVDREEDGGRLAAHKAFWTYPSSPRENATITEMIFVPEEVEDGKYLLHFQITSMEIDASPSKPVIYKVS
ncbi:MAG: arylformamidase [Limisphaerales bacterium]|jgi:arylformamidase